MNVVKQNQTVQRKVITLGDDQFCIDNDGEVYRNGFGQVFANKRLHYQEGEKRRSVHFGTLFDNLFLQGITTTEAIRRSLIKASWDGVRLKKNRLKAALAASSMRLRRNDGRIFKSMSQAAKELGCTTGAISLALKQDRPVKGYVFQKISS